MVNINNLVILSVQLYFVSCAKRAEYAVIESILNSASYDSKIRPGAETDESTVVHLNMFINDVSAISEVNMEYSAIIFFRQEWYDRRLATSALKKPVTLSYKHVTKIWVPDVFMPNEKSAKFHDVTIPNVLLRLDPDGKLLYSQRLSLKLNCVLHLQDYPFDNQTCAIKFESYGNTLNEVELRWRDHDPIQNNTEMKLPEFSLQGIVQDNCSSVYLTGTFSCMSTKLFFKREVAYFLTQTFLPSILIVVLSWVAFWIDYRAVPARITLGLLTVLTVTTQSSSISQRLPKVSYTKAIDVWMSTCLVFVFMALVEFAIVNVLARVRESDKIENNVVSPINISGGAETKIEIDDNNGEEPNYKAKDDRSVNKTKNCIPEKYWKNKAQFLDTASRVFFPSSFLLFNIVFWSLYH